MTVQTYPLPARRSFTDAVVANRILRIAEQHPGFKQAKAWKQYAAAFETAMTLMSTPAPQLNGLATDKIEQVIREHAKALADHHALVEAAGDAAQYANSSLAMETRGAVDQLIELVSKAFTAALGQFKAVNRSAPDQLSGYENAEAVEAYQTRQRAAFELTNLIAQRIELGRAISESGVVPDLGLWCWLEDPDEDVSPADMQIWLNVVRSIGDFAELSPVERFRIFVERDMPLSIAARGKPERRKDAWDQARNRAQGEVQLTMLGEMQRRQALGLPTGALPVGG